MKTENRYYEVTPKIVPADGYTTITVKGRFSNIAFKDDVEYEIGYYPVERFSQTGEYKYQERHVIKPVNGNLSIHQFFKGEQEHILEIGKKEGENPGEKLYIRIYSLSPDLFMRKPYKGDMHMHSCFSDGKEDPGFVAASCRKIGLDFMALTDHGLYHPSITAQECYKNVDVDMLICRGEEVHPVNNPVHMINFGGSFSVNETISRDEKTYLDEVKKIEQELTGIEDTDARYQCASSMWTFQKIREGGGMGIFCHPYWMVGEGYYISDTVISYMLEKMPFDALELIGGYHRWEMDSNKLQVARYQEARAEGKKIPIVGVSDAHGCENSDLFGWYYTIVFSPALCQPDIIGSVKELYSVAVEAVAGESARVYGPFRLVKYALFLLREVLPEHDEMCLEEGNLMMRYHGGEKEAVKQLQTLQGRTAKLLDTLWASH